MGNSRQRKFKEPTTLVGKHMRDTARKLRRDMTDAESKPWFLLRDRRLTGFKFRRQVPIGPYIADFACFANRLIVEADGGQHADSPHDAERDVWLSAQGYRILRFWNSDILANAEGVVLRIIEHRALEEAAT
jgi:very-short-patch-repair endonuclease